MTKIFLTNIGNIKKINETMRQFYSRKKEEKIVERKIKEIEKCFDKIDCIENINDVNLKNDLMAINGRINNIGSYFSLLNSHPHKNNIYYFDEEINGFFVDNNINDENSQLSLGGTNYGKLICINFSTLKYVIMIGDKVEIADTVFPN
jgi:hypothetical protein